MPLTNPSYPPGPYRFINREYLIITYRTDPDALRAVVPEPLEIIEPHRQIRIHPHAGFDRFRRLHRSRSSHSRAVQRHGRHLCPCHVSRRRARRSPVAASYGASRRNSPRPSSVKSDVLVGTLHYGSVLCAAGTMGYKHRIVDHAGAQADEGAELPGQDHPACRRHAAHLRTGALSPDDITVKGPGPAPRRSACFRMRLPTWRGSRCVR